MQRAHLDGAYLALADLEGGRNLRRRGSDAMGHLARS